MGWGGKKKVPFLVEFGDYVYYGGCFSAEAQRLLEV